MLEQRTHTSAAGSNSGNAFGIVVIAASAGGVRPLLEILAALPASFPLPIVIVLHHSPHFPSTLPKVLGWRTELRVKWAENGEAPLPGVVYVAPAHCRTTITANCLLSLDSAKARFRPPADPLFESAASAFGARTIGVVLSGVLDDGTRGSAAVVAAGGVGLAQCENSSQFFDMPAYARDFGRTELIASPTKIATYLKLMGELPLSLPAA